LPMVFFFTGLSVLFIMPLIGKLSDKVSKFKLFAAGSIISVIMILIYTNLNPIPLWEIVVINMILFMGIMSRMIPATTLNTAIPGLEDRGAYMSISSSLQQIAGGIAAVCAGFIVHQKTKSSPLENYDILGYVIAVITAFTVLLIWRVNQLAKKREVAAKEIKV
jgi:predicted MFS family arabinose efflux permease